MEEMFSEESGFKGKTPEELREMAKAARKRAEERIAGQAEPKKDKSHADSYTEESLEKTQEALADVQERMRKLRGELSEDDEDPEDS